MKKQMMLGLVLAACLALLSSEAFGQTVSITGKVLEVSSSMLTVQSGKDVWQITLGPATKVTGEAKIGSTVSVTCPQADAQKKEITAPSSS